MGYAGAATRHTDRAVKTETRGHFVEDVLAKM